ncbi:MAG TPA: hypothetical protein VMR62_38060 [Bryobacteraceae bacterium]|nr:hypothetical protein [Bryobacteraceae bacterium]
MLPAKALTAAQVDATASPASGEALPDRGGRKDLSAPAKATAAAVPEAETPKPEFTLTIAEDKDAPRKSPSLHRVLVKYTRVAIGVESYEFHKEVEGMYNMIVLRDGAPDAETETMRELRRFRKVDHDPETLRAQPLKPGESWTQPLDVSDYYDMTKPGAYQVTVTRESLPLNLRYSVPVSSNTITVVVPPGTGEAEEATEKPEPRFALTISAPDSGPSPPLMIRAEMENTSDSVIRERKCWQSSLYDVSLLRDGEPVEPNNQTRMLQKGRAAGECAGNATLKEIQPGAVDVEGVNIRYLYDIFEPGSYLVKISRETYPYNPAKSVLVESNTLGFTVSPPPPRH